MHNVVDALLGRRRSQPRRFAFDVGGHILSALWDLARHRDTGPKPVLERDPTPAELAVAEAYDGQWQAAYRAEHRSKPHFDDWQSEYLKKRRSEQPQRKRHDEHDHEHH